MTAGPVSGGSLRPIRIGLPGDEIGKKDLVAVARRFQNLHTLQLQRIQESLTPRQRDFLDLLPLLFQINHPLLPGFVSLETPAGIPEYTPSRRALLRAERLTKSFEYRRRALTSYPIWGIYLMGSVGSIAYSSHSDLDIWLCHAPDLAAEALDELRTKAKLVEEWAASLQLEAHIFFIDPDEFRAGIGQPISTESCGSIQHHLLLEEFYRTSLYIAGRIPAWWLVPPEQDGNYTAYLRHLNDNRFIGENELIDFGGLEYVSAEEFLGGTLWHLYKAIGSPHKSLLKLLLMESYSGEYPKPKWLCTVLKAAVYEGSVDIHELDSYLLMYRKVEAYLLNRQEYDRLDLARQCFYLKINELLSVRTSPSSARRERREVLKEMTDSWGWGAVRLQELDARRRCRVEQAIEEQKPITRELTHGYRSVNQFARDYAKQMTLKSDELVLLGRRLYAALEYKPGKVDILSSDGYEEIADQDFSLHATRLPNGDSGWILYADRVLRDDADKGMTLKRGSSLIEILAWLLRNGFYRRQRQQIFLEPGDSTLTGNELKSTLEALEQFLARLKDDDETLDAYGRPSTIKHAALFVNLGNDPDALRKDGMQVTSNRFDPLSFGANRINQILSIDRITVTSWKELLVTRHTGATSLFDSLADLLNNGCPEDLATFSFGSTRSRSVMHRVKSLFIALAAAFPRNAESGTRFVVRGGNEFCVFEKLDDRIIHWPLADLPALVEHLSAPRQRYAPVVFDEAALENSPIPEIYCHNRPGLVQIFCLPGSQAIDLYVLDERGCLFYRRHPRCSPQQLFNPYAVFLNAVQRHLVNHVTTVEHYVLTPKPQGRFEAVPFTFKAESSSRKLSIRIFGLELPEGRLAYSIFCNEREFATMDQGQEMFASVADYILQLRQGGEHYPIYITDVDVPLSVLGIDTPDQLQTTLLLRYKQKIEDRLNA